MNYICFTFYLFAAVAGMEVISYVVHRFLFHGILWRVHKSHHTSRHSFFEWNDIFSLFFALLSISLIWIGLDTPLESVAFPLGLGISIYGVLYFIIHDIFTHKRFIPFKSDNKAMRLIKRAHQRHHQNAGKKGREPYGLFLFPYDRYRAND